MKRGTAVLGVFLLSVLSGLRAGEEETGVSIVPEFSGEAVPGDSAQVIVVTASRTRTPLWETGSSVDVLGSEELEGDAGEPLSDVLGDIPGLKFTVYGTPGQMTTLFTRGTESDHTLVLMDGMRVNDENSMMEFSPLIDFGLGFVEVMRGTGSALYGTDAVGGVINMETLSGSGAPRLSITAAGTSEEGFLYDARFTGSEGPLGYTIGAGGFRYGGPDYPNSDATMYGEFVRMDRDLADGSVLKFVTRATQAEIGWYTNNSSGFGPGVSGVYLDPNDRISKDSVLSVLGWKKEIRPDFEVAIDTGVYNYYGFYNSEAPNDTSGFGVPTGTQTYDLLRYSSGVKVMRAFGGAQKVVWGADFERTAFDKVDTMYGDTRFNGGDNTGVYMQYHKVKDDDLALTLGGRYEFDTEFGHFATWRLSTAFRTGREKNVLLRASAGSAFRAPSFLELYGPWGANPNLEPEKNLGVDAGVEYSSPATGLKASAVYFRNDFKDLIEYDWLLGFQNIAEAMTQGVEVALGRPERADSPFSWKVSGTYTHTEDDSGNALLRRPWVMASAEMTFKLGRGVRLGVDARYVGPRYDMDETYATIRVDGYAVVNAVLSWKPSRSMEVFFKAFNVGDVYYEPVYSFPAPGFNWMLGVKTSKEF